MKIKQLDSAPTPPPTISWDNVSYPCLVECGEFLAIATSANDGMGLPQKGHQKTADMAGGGQTWKDAGWTIASQSVLISIQN